MYGGVADTLGCDEHATNTYWLTQTHMIVSPHYRNRHSEEEEKVYKSANCLEGVSVCLSHVHNAMLRISVYNVSCLQHTTQIHRVVVSISSSEAP